MNVDIKKTMKHCARCLEYEQTQLHEQIILSAILCKPWEVDGADIFSVNNNTLLCVVDYYCKFPIIMKANGMSADDLIRAANIVFVGFR